MWELDYKESWVPKNWCFWTVVLEKTLESPLDSKEIQPVHPKGNQSWIFIGRTDAEAETPILWPPDAKNWLILKNPDAGQDWRQEKRTTEDEMVGWHHRLDGHEFEQIPRVGDRQGSLSCCSPWVGKESDTTKWLNWTEVGLHWSSNSLQELGFHKKWVSSSHFSCEPIIFVMLSCIVAFCFWIPQSSIPSQAGQTQPCLPWGKSGYYHLCLWTLPGACHPC